VSSSAGSTASTDSVLVEFPATEGYRSVGRLVLGGLASRFELPVDRVEDLLLAVESLLLHGVAGDTVRLEVEADDDGLRVRLGPFADGAVGDPAVARVVSRLVDEAAEVTSENGDGAFAELLVSAARHRRDG
jgi:anti-sigma regulatory factor (Ser/Thr protein kinase)